MERVLVIIDPSGPGQATMHLACHLLTITADDGARPDESILASENIFSVLESAQCPVFAAPLTTKNLSEIVFTYDGSASSVAAIKQFTLLFPELRCLPVTLLEVKSAYSYEIDFRDNINRYLRTHYRYLNKLTLEGESDEEMLPFLLDKKQMYIARGGTTAMPAFISNK
jgi:hypothetical protein